MHLRVLIPATGVCLAIAAQGQLSIGQWRDHFPYRKAIAVAEGDNGQAWCATLAGIFRFDPASGEIDRFTKVNALNDVNVRTIAWCPAMHQLLVGYQNGNLDLIGEGVSRNLGDIERSSIVGDKGIYHAHFEGTTAYLSCGFGIVVVDLVALEVRETWLIGAGGAQIQVNAVDLLGDSIYAATDVGLYSAWRFEPNLASFTNWSKRLDIPNPGGPFSKVVGFGGRLVVNFRNPDLSSEKDTLYYLDGNWQKVSAMFGLRNLDLAVSHDGQFLVAPHLYGVHELATDMSEAQFHYGYPSGVMYPAQAVRSVNGYLWVADRESGLRRTSDGAHMEPNGPKSVSAYRMSMAAGGLYVATGSPSGNWGNQFLKEGVHSFIDGTWSSTDNTNDPIMQTGVNSFGGAVNDILAVAADLEDPHHAWMGSWDDGLLELRDRHVVAVYNADNSTLLNEASAGEAKVNVGGLDFDADGNLWMTNANTSAPIAVRTAAGSWRSFSTGSLLGVNTLVSDILAASNGIKWVIRPRSNGMLVFHDGGTISDTGDDQYKLINTFEGQGGLPSMDVYSMAEDRDGEVWLGTGKGVAVFYAPDAIFSGGDFDAQQILIEQDGNIQILLETEVVSALVVDGANRKWLGTLTSGAYLVSPDGTELIHHFTTGNSPLPSDNITSIALDELTGEVFFGTDQGTVSFRGDATEGLLEATCATVFPNPVHPGFTGPIAITGLVRDSEVRITDIAGNLVYRTVSNGGEAMWPGTDMEGTRVSTGVYLALAVDPTGVEHCNTRILVVR